jgi:hypothetical protein
MHRQPDHQRREADHGGRGPRLAPAVAAQLQAEGHAAHDGDAQPDQHVVDHDHHGRGAQQGTETGRGERVHGGRVLSLAARQHEEQQAADRVAHGLLGHVEGDAGPRVPPPELDDEHSGALGEHGVLPAVHGVQGGGEREPEAGPVRLAAGEHRPGLAEQHESGKQPEHRRLHGHVRPAGCGPVPGRALAGGRGGGQRAQAEADHRAQVRARTERRVGPERPPSGHSHLRVGPRCTAPVLL